MPDIENELRHYKEAFSGKTVLCNCDDPFESNFFKYFAMNFNHLGLKKLICTSYAGSPISYTELSDLPLFRKREKMPYMIEITEVADYNGDGAEDLADIEFLLRNSKNTLTILDGDGDFRSEECIGFLRESDIVVTNPPFSLFKEYVALLSKYEKHFIILSNMNAITYKDIFQLIMKNKIWVGYGFNMSMVYKTPYPNLLEANRKFVISKGYNPDDGYVKVPAICWFTNVDIKKRHEELALYKKYNKDEYPMYVTFDAIDVAKVSEIPVDYYDALGVPKTFMRDYNPEQFEIIGYEREDENIKIGIKRMGEKFIADYRAQGGKGHYTSNMRMLCYYNKDGKAVIPFSRIIIKRRKNEN